MPLSRACQCSADEFYSADKCPTSIGVPPRKGHSRNGVNSNVVLEEPLIGPESSCFIQ